MEKAYDWVPRSEVWNCLRLKGVAEKYIHVIQDMYRDSRTKVKCAAGLTDDFQVTVGLHQGSALSPLLFAIVMDCLTRKIRREAPWDVLFADDVALCGESREKLETRLETWRRAMEDRGMRVSRQKTEYLCIGEGEADEEVKLQGEKLKRVEEFKYLGSTVQMDGGPGREVQKRIQAGWGTWRKITTVLCDRRVPPKLKSRLYKVMVRPAMLYGIEALAVTKRQESKMEVAEMEMLRFSLGKTRMDKFRDEDTRKTMGVDELGGKLRETRTEVAGACCETGRGLYWKKNAEVCSWEEERQTEEMLGRLHQGRSGEWEWKRATRWTGASGDARSAPTTPPEVGFEPEE